MNFPKKAFSTALNGIYTNACLRGMLHGKDYKIIDTIFSIVFTYVDTWLSDNDSVPFTEVHTLYTSITKTILSENHSNGWMAETWIPCSPKSKYSTQKWLVFSTTVALTVWAP